MTYLVDEGQYIHTSKSSLYRRQTVISLFLFFPSCLMIGHYLYILFSLVFSLSPEKSLLNYVSISTRKNQERKLFIHAFSRGGYMHTLMFLEYHTTFFLTQKGIGDDRLPYRALASCICSFTSLTHYNRYSLIRIN